MLEWTRGIYLWGARRGRAPNAWCRMGKSDLLSLAPWTGQPNQKSPGAARGKVLLRACRGTAAVVRRCRSKAGSRLNPKVPRSRCRTPGSCARKLPLQAGPLRWIGRDLAESSHLCPAQHPQVRHREESPALLWLHKSSSCCSALLHGFLSAMRTGVPRNTYSSARILLLFVAPGSF